MGVGATWQLPGGGPSGIQALHPQMCGIVLSGIPAVLMQERQHNTIRPAKASLHGVFPIASGAPGRGGIILLKLQTTRRIGMLTHYAARTVLHAHRDRARKEPMPSALQTILRQRCMHARNNALRTCGALG